jgi:hypothetical protein
LAALVHNSNLEALTELDPVWLAVFVLVISTAWYLVGSYRCDRPAGTDVLLRRARGSEPNAATP